MCVWDRNVLGEILLLLVLSTVDGLRLFEVKEGDDVPLQFDGADGTDLSSLFMTCHFKSGPSGPPRLVLQVERGAEKTQNQDPQFSGRVRSFQEGLAQGRVRILLTGLGLQDSGHYTCDVTAPNTDKTKRPFFKSEDFVVNVTSRSTVMNPKQPHNADQNKAKTNISEPFYNKRKRIIPFVAFVIFVKVVVIVIFVIKRNDHKSLWCESIKMDLALFR